MVGITINFVPSVLMSQEYILLNNMKKQKKKKKYYIRATMPDGSEWKPREKPTTTTTNTKKISS